MSQLKRALKLRNVVATSAGMTMATYCYVAGIGIMASMTSYNTGFMNFSRFMYAMGRDNVLPRAFSKIHPRLAILVTFTISIVASKYLFFKEKVMIFIT